MIKTARQRSKRMSTKKNARITKVDLANQAGLAEAHKTGAKRYLELHPTKGYRNLAVNKGA
jgi:hypothetical protein